MLLLIPHKTIIKQVVVIPVDKYETYSNRYTHNIIHIYIVLYAPQPLEGAHDQRFIFPLVQVH